MSNASEIYTIIAALNKAEETMDLKKNWKSKDEIQDVFLKMLKTGRNDIIGEIELEVSDNADKINTFLKNKGFSIMLEPFPHDTIGFASILDLIMEWLFVGEKIKIDSKKGEKYDGVRIKKGGVTFFVSTGLGYEQTIACIQTISGDMVFIMVPKKPVEGLDLINMTDTIYKNMDKLPDVYGGLRFPMVDLDITNDMRWLTGLSTINKSNMPAEISQAIQQIKFKMNDKGTRVKSGTAIGITLLATIPKPDLIINEPFIVWVERHNIEMPIMAAYVTEESWKDPGNL